ncbi:MAG: undecaprenyl-phosphate glucose phosphotransferase, partial [Hyphomicrobiales bacterium]|nr:undecaprenyl-phosphate glucose phosphotransferase [Hyphomicrobiales bacterium]
MSEAAASSARRVFILAPFQALTQLEKITSALRKLPISAMLLTEDWAARSLSRPVALDPRLTAFEMQAPPLDLAERAAKRGMDIFVSALSLFFLSPFMLAIAIAVRLEGPGPILFHQWRLGFNGRKFQIVKFRSMTVTEDGASITQVRRDDARVTRVGAFLRARSLDEIPQLINVLRGDMSLVGPRPHAVAHDNYYDDLIADYSMRRHMKPGLTGWAQVSGLRGETPTVARMATRVDH